ncbi:MAG: hypothetical protein H6636_02460 [Anaerolineales bacterium]|nr:hypothetical protein [Anaerolineales bacterium]
MLDLLSTWAARPTPNVWLITRALSASWALSHREQATQILTDLTTKAGRIRPILRVLEKYG